jgi:two-component sensor histidine kinase
LGKAHDLLLQSKWSGAKLAELIHTAIEPFGSDDVRRFAVRETEIEVGPAAVLPLMMALNELCTNAVKYGALSNNAGQVEIVPAFDADARRLSLTWTERGGPPVLPPTRHSFGTRLINRLASELGGEVQLKYEPAGLVCEFSVPVVRPA